MILFYATEIENDKLTLRDDEFRHATKSLRKKEGQNLQVIDGKGHLYQVTIAEIKRNTLVGQIISTELKPESKPFLHMALAPTKNTSRFEWFVEKAVELGIHKITPIITDNSERKTLNLERVNRIAISAMKQSLHFHLPLIEPVTTWKNFLLDLKSEQPVMAHFDPQNKHLVDVIDRGVDTTILIGPEGDFSAKEMLDWKDKQWRQVNISESRLRTETAGIVACNIFHTKNRTQTQ